jgi:hypothetical protein
MWSAEMDPDDMLDNIPLSDDRLKGKLHIEGIKTITVNRQPFTGQLKIETDNGEILDLEIQKNHLELFVEWCNFKSPAPTIRFSSIQIEAEKIYWEPVPDLVDPFW